MTLFHKLMGRKEVKRVLGHKGGEFYKQVWLVILQITKIIEEEKR